MKVKVRYLYLSSDDANKKGEVILYNKMKKIMYIVTYENILK